MGFESPFGHHIHPDAVIPSSKQFATSHHGTQVRHARRAAPRVQTTGCPGRQAKVAVTRAHVAEQVAERTPRAGRIPADSAVPDRRRWYRRRPVGSR
ncbi:hypothetical protein [Lysobacter gummosus]|uniref:hypothetical protein n=1 Tax=Lysobacter gummosus TaxID=262324 RepID=UPI0036267580